MEFLNQHWKEIAAAVGALIAGGLAFKFISKKTSTKSNKVVQRNNKVGGDIAGRDIKK